MDQLVMIITMVQEITIIMDQETTIIIMVLLVLPQLSIHVLDQMSLINCVTAIIMEEVSTKYVHLYSCKCYTNHIYLNFQ